jgi:hypothetical protein
MEGTGAGVYVKSLGRRLRISLENMLQFLRLRDTVSWPGLMKFKRTSGEINMLVFALIVRQLRELFRLPKQHLHW